MIIQPRHGLIVWTGASYVYEYKPNPFSWEELEVMSIRVSQWRFRELRLPLEVRWILYGRVHPALDWVPY